MLAPNRDESSRTDGHCAVWGMTQVGVRVTMKRVAQHGTARHERKQHLILPVLLIIGPHAAFLTVDTTEVIIVLVVIKGVPAELRYPRESGVAASAREPQPSTTGVINR